MEKSVFASVNSGLCFDYHLSFFVEGIGTRIHQAVCLSYVIVSALDYCAVALYIVIIVSDLDQSRICLDAVHIVVGHVADIHKSVQDQEDSISIKGIFCPLDEADCSSVIRVGQAVCLCDVVVPCLDHCVVGLEVIELSINIDKSGMPENLASYCPYSAVAVKPLCIILSVLICCTEFVETVFSGLQLSIRVKYECALFILRMSAVNSFIPIRFCISEFGIFRICQAADSGRELAIVNIVNIIVCPANPSGLGFFFEYCVENNVSLDSGILSKRLSILVSPSGKCVRVGDSFVLFGFFNVCRRGRICAVVDIGSSQYSIAILPGDFILSAGRFKFGSICDISGHNIHFRIPTGKFKYFCFSRFLHRSCSIIGRR